MAQVIIKFGDDISTDTIYPGRFMATVLPTETPAFAFADYKEFNKQLNDKKFPQGSIIIAGNNFGCGSSREQAVSCLKGHELVIVAKSYARIFLQNAVNLGLQALTAPDIEATEGDELVVADNRIVNKTTGKSFTVIPLSGSRQAVMNAGGLISYTRERLVRK
ncbi:MAG TPA: 3-isopropylmalate dehydratase [bacterium]|nr:3-isopropylmalate dehydratase [bacterium]HPN43008.1 3-isopropylmalate dehydratase [bacterium]